MNQNLTDVKIIPCTHVRGRQFNLQIHIAEHGFERVQSVHRYRYMFRRIVNVQMVDHNLIGVKIKPWVNIASVDVVRGSKF